MIRRLSITVKFIAATKVWVAGPSIPRSLFGYIQLSPEDADNTSLGPAVYLSSRHDFLLSTQNADGGWGYFPGKKSWMEPTTYALLALHGVTGVESNVARSRALLRTWRRPDGGYQPSGQVQDSTWVTALGLLVSSTSIEGEQVTLSDSDLRSIEWLLGERGAESRLAVRLANFFHLTDIRLDLAHPGWPWFPGNSSWIEPTCHTLLALKKAASLHHSYRVLSRIQEGEIMVLSRRCSDGGWNAGTPVTLSYDLRSYPESTALALLGLQGRRIQEFPQALEIAESMHRSTKSSLARAWLAIALRAYGRQPADPSEDISSSRDILLTALQALGHPAGNYHLLQIASQIAPQTASQTGAARFRGAAV